MLRLPPPPPFYGLIPDSGFYLVYDGNEEYAFTLERSKPDIGENLDELDIQGSWWDYVEGIDADNNTIKYPSPPLVKAERPQPAKV